jgi:serine/threonine protein kinase
MATPTTSVRDYCTLLTKSKLLPADEVAALLKRWREESRGAEDQVDEFRKYLTARRYLTEWQAHMVQRGRADGFFIGGYKILDRVGKGQMGGVYKAAHSLGQIVALKILPASKAKNQHVLGRFQRETRLLTQLDHPNVVRAYQVGEANGVHFICMEFLEGETLDEVITRRKRLPWTEAARLIHQALAGLQHLHEKRMVHRDVKPANMMLTPAATKPDTTWDATVKILDIGLGRELFSEDTPEAQIETQLTVEGAVLGTPDYLAPEQAKDARSADIRADIYSIGCVLYHCLAGTPPFPSTNIMSQMVMHATEPPPRLASVAPDAPPGLQEVFDRLMAKSPDDRYQTPAAAAAAIAPLLRPGGSAPAVAAMVPAFKDWLETESHLEMPVNLPAASPVPAKPVPAKPVAPGAAPPAVKPGPAPASAMKGGTAVAPVVRVPPGGKPPGPASATPSPVAPPAPRPIPVPVPVPVDEVDVELVLEPGLVLVPPPARPEQPKEARSLLEPDRRDWIMLAAGASGVLLAVGLGYGLARLLRKKPEEPPSEE